MENMFVFWKHLAEKLRKHISQHRPPQTMVPLSLLCRNGRFTICKVSGDRKLCARIGALGIYPGAQFELICPHNGSQCILQLQGSRLCLDRTISENILVSEY